jgi:hypothetical protein
MSSVQRCCLAATLLNRCSGLRDGSICQHAHAFWKALTLLSDRRRCVRRSVLLTAMTLR